MRFFSGLGERGGDKRVAAFAPGIQAALQRADTLDAILPEEQRHTGAGGFVWSSTVEDYFAVAGQKVVLLFQLLGVHAEGAGNGFRIGFKVHGVAQIDNDQFFAGVEFFFQFFHGDARDAQVAQKTLAGSKLISDVGGEDAEEKDQKPAAQRGKMVRDTSGRTHGSVTEAEERAGPEERPQRIEKEKSSRTDVKDASKRSRDRAQAREELGQQKGASALLRKKALGAANAGIRLQRNLAKELEDLDAFAAAKLIPDGISYDGREHDVEQRGEKTQVAGACECACREQQRHGRERQPHLLGENPSEQQSLSMMDQEFQSAVHGVAGAALSSYFVAKGAVCPQ